MSEETTNEPDECPVCGGGVNHVVRNGYRNAWSQDVEFWVCTTGDSAWMYVHTEDLE